VNIQKKEISKTAKEACPMKKENTIVYFAYGSNLNVEQMGERCKGW